MLAQCSGAAVQAGQGSATGESGLAGGGNEVNLKSPPPPPPPPVLFIKVLGSRRVTEVDFAIIAKFSPKT